MPVDAERLSDDDGGGNHADARDSRPAAATHRALAAIGRTLREES